LEPVDIQIHTVTQHARDTEYLNLRDKHSHITPRYFTIKFLSYNPTTGKGFKRMNCNENRIPEVLAIQRQTTWVYAN
jgi:hypothetical protein